jgi:hypothetical protein
MKVVAPPLFENTLDEIVFTSQFDCPAIERCCQAWYRTFEKALAQGSSRVMARLRANAAYRFAIPPLNTPENVRDFIACVVHGMMVRSILDDLGTRWLYAAQVASGNLKLIRTKPLSAGNEDLNGGFAALQQTPLPAVKL